MEKKELALIEKHRHSHYELGKLMKEHDSLEAQIAALEKTKGLSAEDEKELHRLKKVKLEGRDRIAEILKTLK